MKEATKDAAFFQHETAIVETPSIGRGTRIWAFAHVLPGAVIGADCNICDHTFIENTVRIGDRVTVKCGVQLWDGVTLEEDVFVGPNATFTNDPFPRSKRHLQTPVQTLIKRGASIGANATILPGLTIGERALIGAGAVVTRNVPPCAIVTGNPARIVGYAGTSSVTTSEIETAPGLTGASLTKVTGVKLYRLPQFHDMRGTLTAAEVGEHVPFEVKRYFLVCRVSGKEVRGEHAHHTLEQFLVCVHGRCHVVADDGQNRQEFLLDSPAVAVYLPPMTWGTQYKYSEDAVLLVLASAPYDPADYIRDYSEFLQIAASRR
jgi:acetyltransferase-like isoleucine patch superfamily enzyme/dTDP-4-dehydrorhamnose 3,5-epimerase-like enzyme